MVSVRAMFSMLILGFNVNKCVQSSGTKACPIPNSLCLGSCVLGNY